MIGAMSNERSHINRRELQAEPFHYKMCGLDDVFLLNGFTVEETDYGRGASIHDALELHKTIGQHLILKKQALSPRAVRFLRREMDLTQEELAKRLGVTAQTVARYEKGETDIPGPADKLLRFVYAMHLLTEKERKAVLDALNAALSEDADDRAPAPVYFGTTGSGEWDEARRVL